MLSVRKVNKQYGDHRALSELSLEVRPGSIFGLLGPNGAGKTSLIRIINQITAPDSGELYFDGAPLKEHHIKEIGYLPEERGLYPKMKLAEQLLYLAQLKEVEKPLAKDRIAEWLKHFELWEWRHKTVEELSKGMAQKVQFIATVIHQPKLLIFDEPFSGFDPINTNLIKDEIRRLREKGATVIFSTHRMDSVEELCDDIALIHKSRKILEGPTQQVREQFKEGVFRFELKGDSDFKLPEEYQILEDRRDEHARVLRLKAAPEQATELLKLMAEKFSVQAFREEVPSLNDIFIKKVQEA